MCGRHHPAKTERFNTYYLLQTTTRKLSFGWVGDFLKVFWRKEYLRHMNDPMALSKNEAIKWGYAAITGFITSLHGSITHDMPPLSIITIIQSFFAVLIITYAGGMIIYGIRRIFGKPKITRSTLRHSLYYGFPLTVLISITQGLFLAKALIMRG